MIAYLRVSTQRQGRDGLGIDAQRSAIAAFAERRGEEVLLEMVEVETGTAKRDRPVLALALLEAKRLNTYIVTAKLDRLARSVAAICAIQQSGVRFVALDLPETENPLFLYMVAALAEYEAKLISERTKAALAAKRARGWKQQPGRLDPVAAARGRMNTWIRAVAREQKMAAHAESLIELGLPLVKIAERLNEEGYRSATGKPLNYHHIRDALDRRAESQGRKPIESKTTRLRRERLDRRIYYANLRQEKRQAEREKRREYRKKARERKAESAADDPHDGGGREADAGTGNG